MANNSDIPFVFFGTPAIAVTILEKLVKVGLWPTLVITAPDKPAGRGMQLTPPPVKAWAETHNIPVLQPEKLSDPDFIQALRANNAQLGVLAAYGKIIPRLIIDLFDKGIVNMHPSLLPKHRGPAPIVSQILEDDRHVGVSVMLLDEEMDHGPLIAQKEVSLDTWPIRASVLAPILAGAGGELLADTIPTYAHGAIKPTPQDHSQATYSQIIQKKDAELDFTDDVHLDEAERRRRNFVNYLKFCAYDEWPRAHFFTEKGARVIITDASYKDGTFFIHKVIPEGKREMPYEDFTQQSH